MTHSVCAGVLFQADDTSPLSLWRTLTKAHPNIVLLTPAMQQQLPFFSAQLWVRTMHDKSVTMNRAVRKNLGYLFAIAHHAKVSSVLFAS
jgi:hypothetical protein